jgi:hypothetical protein
MEEPGGSLEILAPIRHASPLSSHIAGEEDLQAPLNSPFGKLNRFHAAAVRERREIRIKRPYEHEAKGADCRRDINVLVRAGGRPEAAGSLAGEVAVNFDGARSILSSRAPRTTYCRSRSKLCAWFYRFTVTSSSPMLVEPPARSL